MINLTRKTRKVSALLNSVAIRNGFSIIQQSLADPKMIPAAIVLDRQGYKLVDFGRL